MENSVKTQGYYIADYDVNIEAPIDASIERIKHYAKKVSSGLTPEQRIANTNQNIPFNEDVYNSTYSDIEVSDLSQAPRLDKKIYERLAHQKYVEKGQDTNWGSTLLRSGWNQTVDIVSGAYGTLVDTPQDIGASIAYAVNSDKLTPKTRAKFKDELADNALKRIKERKKSVSTFKFDVNEYESSSAQSMGSLLPSGLAMGVLGFSTLLRGGSVAEASSLITLPSLLFGGSSAEEMKQKVLENGGSIADATLRSMSAGIGEYFLEKTGLKAFNQFYKKKHLSFLLLSGAGAEGLQETSQSGKDIFIAGEYDKRNAGQKLDDLFDSAWYGFIGGLLFGVGGAEGKLKILSLREQVYNESVKLGKDHDTAVKIANYAVPDDGVVTKDMTEFLNQELDSISEATPEQMESYKKAYEEAKSVGGADVDKYISAKEELKGLMEKAGVSEEDANEKASYYTGMMIKDYQAIRDNGADVSFDDVKDKFYKLNKIINNDVPETSEQEKEEIWKEIAREKAERTERYAQEKHKWFSKQIDDEVSKIDKERLEFERKDINPELKGREDEEVKAVKINRFFADRTSSKDISIEDVIAKIDETVSKNENGVRVLKNSITGETVTLSNNSISKMFDTTAIRDGQNIGGILGKESIANIRDIFDSAMLVKTHNDNKRGTKNKIRRYANVINSDGENFIVKITVKELSNNRKELTDFEIENNKGKDLANYDLKVGRKNTAVNSLGSSEVDKSISRNSGNGIIVNDLIDFVNTYTEKTININGVDRTTTNSSGQRIAKTPEGLRAFYKWFGDSKVVDEQGRPLVVYHGTLDDFDEFSKDRIGTRHSQDDIGFYFTNKKNVADDYASSEFDYTKKGKVIPTYINGKKPLKIDNKWAKDNGLGSVFDREDSISFWDNYQEFVKDEMQKIGADSIIIDDGYQQMVVALEPNQIKSVDNRGSFSSETGNIYHSKTNERVIGAYNDLTREIELFKGQNPSTLMHELSHHFMYNHLMLMESMGLKDRNAPVFEWLSKKAGREINSVAEMEDADHENLVEAFIAYMNLGEAPNLATQNIFKRAKEWLLDMYSIHRTEASPEIRDYFDSLVARDDVMPDVSGLTNRVGELAEILRQAKNGEQVSFKGLGKKEINELYKAIHTRVRRKGMSLRDELIASGGIKEGTELAKSLGFDVLKKDKMYTTKETAIEKEDELIEWLANKGYIVGAQEGEDYSVTERRWEEVLSLINNADNIYTAKESLLNQERETALVNQAHAQEIIDELLKDNKLGFKSVDDLSDLLSKIVSRKDDVDITKINTNALKYIEGKAKDLNKEIRKALRKKDLSFKNKREEQYLAQNDLKDFIRGLPISGQHKVSLMGNIQRVKDYESLAKVFEDIKPRVKKYIEQEAKQLMATNIDNIIKQTKPKERKKQRFNYDYNKLFEELREYNKLTKEKASEKVYEVLNNTSQGRDNDGGEILPFVDEHEKLKNMFLQYKSKGMETSLDLMKRLNDELSSIYNEAVNDKLDTDIAKSEQREKRITDLVNYIENTKAVNKLNQALLKMTNLNSNLSELFGKKWADEHKMDSYLIKQDIETNKTLDDVIRQGKDIYNLKNREEFVQLTNDMRVPKDEYTLINYRDDMSQPISKMQLIDIYLTIKNKGSAEAYTRLYENFDENGNQITTQIEDLLSNLSAEDKKFGDMLQKKVNDLYDAENKVYVKLYGIDMPKHDNYWMRTSERSERELMDIKQFANLDMIPSFMKERSKTPSVYPDDAFNKFARRIHDSKYMTEVFEHYKDLYDSIHSNRVKKAILKKYDKERYKALNQSLKRISLGGVSDGYNELNNMLGKAVTNWVVSKISLSESVFVKQLASFTNYMENVPVDDFVRYEAEFWANPKKAWKFMDEFAGEYLSHRLKSGIQNEVLQRILTSKPEDYSRVTGGYQKYLNFITAPVRYGDIGAIKVGGYARARYLLDQGIPLDQARKKFIEETESAQQSGNKAELSEFQNNTLWRVFTAFKNTNLQYMRKMQDSYIQYTRGEIDAKQFGKIWGNYMVVQSILYQVLTNVFSWWRDDDDEELKPMKDVWMRILTAPVAGLPVVSDITEGVFAENYWGLNITGKQDMELFISSARDTLNGEFDAKKIAKGSVALASFFRPMPDRIIKGVINLIDE